MHPCRHTRHASLALAICLWYTRFMFLFLLLSVACSSNPDTQLPDHVQTISGVDHGAPLPPAASELLAGAEIVGIGESVHLSGGLEQARAWLAFRLVEEHGFRRLAMEISWAESREVDARLVRCGDGQAWTTPTFDDRLWEGVYPLLEHLCARNRENPDDLVRFFGIDIQDPWRHRAILDDTSSELRRCPGAHVDSKTALHAWGTANGFPKPEAVDRDACNRAIDAAGKDVSGDRDLAVLSMRANTARSWALLADKDIPAAYQIREEAMAEVFHRERTRLGAKKTIVLAHDTHVGRSATGYDPLGSRISDRGAYVPVAVGGYAVENRFDFPMPPPSSGPLADLHALGHPRLWVDLRSQSGPHDALLFVDTAGAAVIR